MALVMAPVARAGYDSPDSATARVTRVTDMLNDVEKQIKQYISEQRARERDGADEGLPLLPRTTYSPPGSSTRPATSQATPSACQASQEIPLDLIFDTPETQVSPARSPHCELNRRGATFHRVDSATAEASDWRSQQWSRAEQEERLAGSAPSPLAMSQPVVPAGSPSPDLSGFRAAETVEPMRPASRIAPSYEGAGRPTGLNQRRSRSLTQIKLKPLTITTLPPSHLRSHSASPQTPGTGVATGSSDYFRDVQPPVPLFAHKERRPSAPVQSSAMAGAGSGSLFHADGSLRETILVDDIDQLKEALRFDASLEHLPPPPPLPKGPVGKRPIRATDNREETPSKKAEARSWLPALPPTPLKPSAPRESVKARAKAKSRKTWTDKAALTSKKPGLGKKWAVGESVTDILTGRAFQRLEVDEMIDTSALSPQRKKREQAARDAPAEDQSPAKTTPKLHPPPPVPPLWQHPAFQSSEVRQSRYVSHSRCASMGVSNDSNPSRRESIHRRALSSQPSSIRQSKHTVAPGGLSTIAETSGLAQPERRLPPRTPPARPPRPAPEQIPSFRSSTVDLPVPVLASPLSPTFIHGPIRLEVPSPQELALEKTSGEDTLDWIAFQMAISGPTGDYFMGGETLPESTDDDDLSDWFTSYGFPSAGRLVDHDEELCSLFDEDGEVRWSPPVELPALDSGASSARTSEVHLDSDEDEAAGRDGSSEVDRFEEADPPTKMSANLNDLGDFLSFETYHVSAFEDGGEYD